MKLQAATAVLALIVLFTGCAKDGADGPAGPAGPQGNANVRSETFSVSPGDWSTMSGGYAVNRSTSIVTNEIVSTGSLLAYFKAGSANQWIALPFSGGGLSIAYQYGPGQVQIEYYSGSPITQVTEWKIVAIASSGMIVDSGVNVHDYEAVRAHFDLEE